jgi:hypothetical protein
MPDHLLLRFAEAIAVTEPTPIYHRLAAVVRWEIQHGRLPLNSVLPPVRRVAEAAGVNYHTVRRAWADLEAEGIITQRRGRGARVVREPKRLAWSPAAGSPRGSDGLPRVWVVADALDSAAVLATSLMARRQIEAVPWPTTAAAPPPGIILCFGSIAARVGGQWPDREGDIRALSGTLAQATIVVLRRNAALLNVKSVLLVGGGDEAVAADLLRQLPRLGLAVTRGEEGSPGSALDLAADALVLYFPAAWQHLDWASRMHPRAVMAELSWAAGPLAGVAREQEWVAAGGVAPPVAR